MHKFKASKLFALSTALLGLILTFGVASAADIRTASQNNPNVTVSANESLKNLYAAAGNVLINGNTTKDINAVGGMVTVNGNAADNLMVAGGNIFLNGSVGGSLKAAGGNITISNKITDDAVIAGGNVNITSNSKIGGDLIIAAGTLNLDAPVSGNLEFAGGNLLVNSKVDGDINAHVGKITFGPNANVQGTVNYFSQNKAQVDTGANVVHLNFKQSTSNNSGLVGLYIVAILFKTLAAIIAAFILFALFKVQYENFVRRTGEHFWLNVLWGFMILVLAPIAGIIFLVTLVGFYLAILLLFAYLLVFILGALVGISQFGVWVLSKIRRRSEGLNYGSIATGFAAIAILNLIPVVGIVVTVILIFSGIGSFIYTFKEGRV